jgi:acetolactate synthase-1/2/3 large subunit
VVNCCTADAIPATGGAAGFCQTADAFHAVGRAKRVRQVDDVIQEMLATDRTVIVDMVVDEENCFPVIPSGAAHGEMILGPEHGARPPASPTKG